MKHRIFIGLLSLAVSCTSTIGAQTTQKLFAAKHNDFGLVYSLPITHLDIEVEAIQTIKKAGPYYQYAKKYLGTTEVITEDSQTWTLKSVNVTPYGVPDKDNQYLVQMKGGNSPFMMLTEEGLPLSVNVENVQAPTVPKQGVGPTKSILDGYSYGKSVSGEILMSESIAKRAELAANQIYKIRESRTNYATGEADQMPPDGEAMKLILQQLDNQEAALTALFLGTTQKASAVAHFDYVPTTDVTNEVALRISDFNGIVNKDDLSGAPVYLTLKVTTRGEIPLDEKGVEKKLLKGALMYKIPGQAEITLKYDGKQVFDQSFDIAQFGIEYGLNPSMFTDKKQPSYLKFYPATGGIKEIGTATPTQEQ